MRILALAAWWPEPANNGARLRIANLLRALAQHHEIHLIAFAQEAVSPAQIGKVRELCASVEVVPEPVWRQRSGEQIMSLWRAEPSSFRATWSAEFAQCVDERVSAVKPEAIVAFEINTARYVTGFQGIPRIFEELEIGSFHTDYVMQQTPQRRLRAWLTWRKHIAYVRRLLRHFDACTVVSANEQRLVSQIAPEMKAVHVLPNGTHVNNNGQSWGEPVPDTLIYPGALTYDANLDAVDYFLRDIFPRVRAARPAAQFVVTGAAPPERRARLPQSEQVEFSGYVADVRPLIAQSWAEVVPLRQGGGTRLKVLEALALGTPVVSTPKGVEGLDLINGTHVLIASTADEFAAATLRLLDQPGLRQFLAANGYQRVSELYDWRMIGRQLNELVADVATRRVTV